MGKKWQMKLLQDTILGTKSKFDMIHSVAKRISELNSSSHTPFFHNSVGILYLLHQHQDLLPKWAKNVNMDIQGRNLKMVIQRLIRVTNIMNMTSHVHLLSLPHQQCRINLQGLHLTQIQRKLLHHTPIHLLQPEVRLEARHQNQRKFVKPLSATEIQTQFPQSLERVKNEKHLYLQWWYQ